MTTNSALRPSPKELPVRMGPYVLFRYLEKGGMASLCLAYDLESRTVVLLKRPQNLYPENISRFADEVRLSQELSHPNLVRALSSGKIGGEPYLILERILGQDVESFIDRMRMFDKPRSIPLITGVVSQAAQGLAYAHSRQLGFVHRDLTPANVMIGYDGRAQLLDYGFALSLFKKSRTQTGVVPGTAGYISPEQRLGQKADERSDVFMLGALFWYMLLAQPFTLTLGYTRQQFEERILAWVDLPMTLRDFLWTSLAENPDERFQTAEAFLAALKNSVDEPIWDAAQIANYISELFESEKKEALEESRAWNKMHDQAASLPDSAEPDTTQPVIPNTMVVGAAKFVPVKKPKSAAQKNQTMRYGLMTVAAAAVMGLLLWLFVKPQEVPASSNVVATRPALPPAPVPAAPEPTAPVAEPMPPAPTQVIVAAPTAPELVAKAPAVVVAPTMPSPSALPLPLEPNPKLPSSSHKSAHKATPPKAPVTIVATPAAKPVTTTDPPEAGPAPDTSVSAVVKVAQAATAYQKGNFQEAVSLATEANANGVHSQALLIRANAYLKLGNSKKAVQDFERILQKDPENQAAKEGLASVKGQ